NAGCCRTPNQGERISPTARSTTPLAAPGSPRFSIIGSESRRRRGSSTPRPGDQSLVHLCRPREGEDLAAPAAGTWVPAFVGTTAYVSCGVVEPRGVEPLTSSLRTRRSPN